jgi:F-type H+-transporting ATPase subunit O
LETVEGELNAFSAVVKKSPGLAAFLGNPTIPRAEKTTKIGDLLEESKFSHVTRNLFLTLSANGRVGEVNKVIASYNDLMQASRGAVDVTIISAESLKKKQVETIQQAVMKFVGSGKAVDVKLHVEPSILGGLQILVGDKFLDLSVNSRISDLTKTLDHA